MRVPVGIGYVTIRGQSLANVFGPDVRTKDGKPRPHQGWDCAAFVGSPVFAITDGVIAFVQSHDVGDYGKQICLKFAHKGQDLYAFYAHLNTTRVAAGQAVSEGEVLGTSGQTGNAKGQHHAEAHLHFEIRTSPHGGAGLAGRIDPALILGISPVIEAVFSGFKL